MPSFPVLLCAQSPSVELAPGLGAAGVSAAAAGSRASFWDLGL